MFPSFGLFAPSSAMLVVGSYVSVFSYSFFLLVCFVLTDQRCVVVGNLSPTILLDTMLLVFSCLDFVYVFRLHLWSVTFYLYDYCVFLSHAMTV